jgi:signal transduction histidine kinase
MAASRLRVSKRTGSGPRPRVVAQERLEKELVECDDRIAARDELFATVSHDLRNLINVIQLKSRLLLTELEGDDKSARARKLANEIHRSTRRMLRWSKDLVDVATVEAGKLNIVMGQEDPVAIIREAVEFSISVAEAKGLTVDVDVPEGAALIRCDADRIVEVLINLLDNAVKHTPAGGSITVALSRLPDRIAICVSDTGPGIDPDDVPFLFERYWKARRDARGLGMGLYICRHIIEQHGGTIDVDTALGHGSKFRFTLPR